MVLADSFYYQPVQIDTINTRVNADLFAKEGDANGRGMVVQITENGMIKDTTGITLRLQWSHISVVASGFTDFEVVDATKGLYKVKYPTSMLHRGRVEAFIRISDNGVLFGTRNLFITVERMVGSDETIEAADDFSALQTALTRLSSWEATISGKVDTWESDMEATKQLYIDTLSATEAGYPQELVVLQGQLADNNQTLTTKMDKTTTDIGVTQINKNKGKLDETFMTDTLLQQIAGTTPIGAVPADFSLVQQKIADNSVNERVLDGTVLGKNLFDKTSITAGFYVYTNGQKVANADKYYSDFIAVSASTAYYRTKGDFICFYDANRVLISGITSTTAFTTPANTVFIIISGNLVNLNAEQVERGTVATTYEAYKYSLNKLNVKLANLDKLDVKLTGEYIADKALDEFKQVTNLFSKNLFNKDKITNGFYVWTNGALAADAGSNYTDYIAIEPNTDYYLHPGGSCAIYDANKKVVGGFNQSLISTPSNAKYIRFTVRTVNVDICQFEKGTARTTYIPYRYRQKHLRPYSSWFGKKWATIGDSITNMKLYQPYVCNELGMTFSSHAIGGSRVAGTAAAAMWQDVRVNALPLDTDVVTIMGGTNDANNNPMGTISLSNVDTSTFVGAYNVMLDKIYTRFNNDIRIVLITPPFNAGDIDQTNLINCVNTVIAIGALWGLPVVDVYKNSGINFKTRDMFFGREPTPLDFTHPIQAGHARIAEVIVGKFRQIEPLEYSASDHV